MEASGQVQLFILIMVTGMGMAAGFDFYRVVRNILRLKLILTSVLDLVYWLVATFVVFAVLLAGNWGEVRFYVFIALLTGAGLYYRFFSRFVMTCMVGIIRALVTVGNYLRRIIRGIAAPFKYVARLLRRSSLFLGRKIRQITRGFRVKR